MAELSTGCHPIYHVKYRYNVTSMKSINQSIKSNLYSAICTMYYGPEKLPSKLTTSAAMGWLSVL